MDDLGTTDLVIGPAKLRGVVERVGQGLNKLGLSPNQSSRFALHRGRLESLLNLYGKSVKAPTLSLRRYQQAIYDFCVLDMAMSRLGPAWKPHVEKVLGGNDLPWRDKNDIARNSEFELYLAAVLRRAGFKVWPCEPDVLFEAHGWRLCVAAKRLRSRAKFRERVRDGVCQITRSKVPGFVAVDASVTCLSRDEYAQGKDPHIVSRYVHAALNDLSTELLGVEEFRQPSPFVLGVMLTAFVPTFLIDGSDSTFSTVGERMWITTAEKTNPRAKQINRIARQIAAVPLH